MVKLSVPDMSCGHCKASIQEALSPLGADVTFDMAQREIEVSGLEAAEIVQKLEEIGFPAEVK